MHIPEDYMLSNEFYHFLDGKWGPHNVDLLSSNASNQCEKFYALQCSRRVVGINAFGQL